MPRFVLVLAALLALSCDPPSAPTDGGTDAPRVRDTGVDAPTPRVDLCAMVPSSLGSYPAPDAFPAAHGPGLGTVDTTVHPIGVNCAYLDAGPEDVTDHHNLGVMYDGYLLLPWAPEWGMGGFTFFDVSDPCAPTVAGHTFSETMRETHAIGITRRGDEVFAVVDQMTEVGRHGGIQFWDITDPTDPAVVADMELPDFAYPDSYARPTLSVFWQYPYVYVGAADTGVHVVDAANPRAPRYVTTYAFEPVLRVGMVQAIGNLLIATAAEGPRTVLLDVTNPESPQPVPGGDFDIVDSTGEPRDVYFTTTNGGYVFGARKEGAGGVMAMDIRDPSTPVYATDYASDGNGGYVFLHEGFAFVGESSVGRIYDVSDLFDADPERVIPAPVLEVDLPGDLDMIIPVGQMVMLSVDEEAEPNRGSSLMPWQADRDTRGPAVSWVWPQPGTIEVGARFGITFDEHVEARTAFEGSVRLYRADAATADEGRVAVAISAQEGIVSVVPLCPLESGVEYVLEVPEGGVEDWSGNATTETVTFRFHT